MRRPSWRVLLAVAAIGLMLVAGGLLWRARLGLAESLVRRAVAAAGVVGAEVRMAEVGPQGALLEGLRVGEPPDLEIERIALRYSFLGLLRGRVKEVALGGVRLRGRVGEAGLSFGALDGAVTGGAPEAPGTPGPARMPALPPLDALVLSDAAIELATSNGVVMLRADAAIELDGDDLAGGVVLRAKHEAGQVLLVLDVEGGTAERTLRLGSGDAALVVPGLGAVALEGLAGEIALPPGAWPHGELTIAEIRSPRLSPVSLRLRLAPDGAAPDAEELPFELTLEAAGGRAKLAGGGRIRLDPPGAEVALQGSVPFAADGLRPVDLMPESAQWLASGAGTVAVRATASAGAKPLGFAARVETDAFDLVTATGISVEGLAGRIDLMGPSPLRTKEETLRFRVANWIGPFEEGVVRWHLRGSELRVEDAGWRYAGGHLTTAGRFDLTAKELPFTVAVQGVSLEQLLAQLDIDQLSGTGTLSGSLPVVYDGEGFRVENGVLTAEPPGGIVRYAPATAAPGSLGLGGDVDVLAGALENFHYTKLRMTLTGALSGDVQARIELAGQNPRYEAGRPVELNVSVETNLPALLRASRTVTGVPESIERRLRGKLPE